MILQSNGSSSIHLDGIMKLLSTCVISMLYDSMLPLVGSGGSQVMVILLCVTLVAVTFLGADGTACM